MDKIKWAVVGTGYIANEFGKGLMEVKDAILQAVVSRNEASGHKYAQTYQGQSVYTDFDEMLEKESVDIVYVAIPNDCHFEYIMKAFDKGIPVLSEKPTVDNQKQLDQVLGKAKEKDLFFMEGMWTRCFPAVRTARKWLEEGKIGAPLTVRASFDIKPALEEWQPWKGGRTHAAGALRDVGIYSLAMAFMVFPEGPKDIHSVMKSNGEVDESFHMLADYGEGKAAFLSGTFNQISNPVVEITGEEGRILIGPEFWHPKEVELITNKGEKELFRDLYSATGFQYEIQEVQECLREGRKESSCYTLEETQKIAAIIERTRKGWGIYYDSDKEA